MNFNDLLSGAMGGSRSPTGPSEMGAILGTLQQSAGRYGVNPAVAPSLLSTVGSFVRSALQDRRRTQGPAEAEALVDRYGGLQPDEQAVSSLFSPQERSRVERSLVEETGLQPNLVQSLLPLLVPLVLKFLQGGGATQPGGQRGNSLLNSFMDADRDGDVDIGDAVRMFSRFTSR